MAWITVISIFFGLATSSYACDLHPQYWCDSIDNSMRCDVYDQCKRYLDATSISTEEVYVTTYYESLCPDSINFIRQMLYPTWLKLKSTGIANFRVVPYGKSCSYDDHGSYSFICQHGKDECKGNKIENCLMKYGKSDPEIYLPVIHCMSTAPEEVLGNAEKCISDAKDYDYTEIMKCADGSEGNELTYKSGLETHALKPAVYFVPWVTINGVHTDSIQEKAMNDLLTLICDSYSGDKPAECTENLAFEVGIM